MVLASTCLSLSGYKGLGMSGRRIMYVMYKTPNRTLANFSFCGLRGAGSRGKLGRKGAYKILCRLRDKGLVGITEYSDGNIYYLTEEGRKVAKPIVEEIDDYKQW